MSNEKITVAADLSVAEVHAIAGCIEFAMSNPECSVNWTFADKDDCYDADKDSWMMDVLKSILTKLEGVDKVSPESDGIITIESSDINEKPMAEYYRRPYKAKLTAGEIAMVLMDEGGIRIGSYVMYKKCSTEYSLTNGRGNGAITFDNLEDAAIAMSFMA